jgi:hypothetical protein
MVRADDASPKRKGYQSGLLVVLTVGYALFEKIARAVTARGKKISINSRK